MTKIENTSEAAPVIDHDGSPAYQLKQHVQKANSKPPFLSKAHFTVSMALRPVRPPMRPARSIMAQPMICPTRIAARPLAMPSRAKAVPVKISASETPAPKPDQAVLKGDVFFIR